MEPTESSPQTSAEPEADARAQRIAQLEARLARPPGVGVRPLVALLGLGVCLWLLWGQRLDVEFASSERQPLELGSEGDYHFDRARSNRYVQVHGTPTVRGTYWQEHGVTLVGVGLRDTPVLVRRATLPTEHWEPGRVPPQPDQRPFLVKGRLLAREDAARYDDAFAHLEAFGEVKPRWVLLAEEHPGGDVGGTVGTGVLMLLAGVNAWLLVRGVTAWLKR